MVITALVEGNPEVIVSGGIIGIDREDLPAARQRGAQVTLLLRGNSLPQELANIDVDFDRPYTIPG